MIQPLLLIGRLLCVVFSISPRSMFRNGWFFCFFLLLASSVQDLAPSFVMFCDFFKILCYRTMDCVRMCVLLVK